MHFDAANLVMGEIQMGLVTNVDIIPGQQQYIRVPGGLGGGRDQIIPGKREADTVDFDLPPDIGARMGVFHDNPQGFLVFEDGSAVVIYPLQVNPQHASGICGGWGRVEPVDPNQG